MLVNIKKGDEFMIVFGYWEKNLGDDLILDTFLARLKREKITDRVCILSKKKYRSYYEAMGCEVICSDTFIYRVLNRIFYALRKPELFYRKCNRREMFVTLGGSLFAEHLDTRVNEAQITNLKYAVDNSKGSFVIGSNFGPYESEKHLDDYKKLFSKMNDVCFRDFYSVSLFENSVRFAPDVVLSINANNNIEDCRYDILVPVNVSRRVELKKFTESYLEGLLVYIKHTISMGKRIKLLVFCEKEMDNQICNRILEMCITENIDSYVEIIDYESLEQIIDLFRGAEYIYATRFHSMILGLIFGKKVFPIIYSNKMKEALMDYCENAHCIIMKEFNIQTARESLRWDGVNKLKTNITNDANKQFDILIKELRT